MEQLLFLLFVLFSVITALLERRKRKRALEEARQAEGSSPAGAPAEIEEEEVGGWPFPMGGSGDPFEPQSGRARRQTRQPQPEEEIEPQEERPDAVKPTTLIQQLEAQARESEGRAAEFADEAKEAARAAQRIQAKQRVDELVKKRLAATNASKEIPSGGGTPRQLWKLSPRKARSAVVYAEILGPPKSLKEQEFG